MEGEAMGLECGFPSRFPEFLIISPPKTGSTWLATRLRRHPELFVPDVKEIRYFSSLFKRLDLNWYLRHFSSADGRVKGEASPSYCLLPVDRVRWILRLMPDVKLIFLMRRPRGPRLVPRQAQPPVPGS